MRKLKLEMEELAVQSFATAETHRPRGTAHAHAYLPDDGGLEPADTEPGMNCFTCELGCGSRGC